MKNTYYILRHGNSIANQKKIIVSDLYNGVASYGLSESGKIKLRIDLGKINSLNTIRNPIIFSSPFKRTVDSSNILSEIFNNVKVDYSNNLKERFFGNYNLLSNKYYNLVWDMDEKSINHTYNFVESVSSVFNRVKDLLNSLEEVYKNKDIILVTHGDTGQILICYLLGIDPKLHRSVPHLQEGELRRVE